LLHLSTFEDKINILHIAINLEAGLNVQFCS